MFNRTRWSAIGAAIAVTFAAGVTIPGANAAVTTGERNVFIPVVPCRLFDSAQHQRRSDHATRPCKPKRSTPNPSPARTATAPFPPTPRRSR